VQSPAALSATQRHRLVPVQLGDLLDPNGPATLHVYAGWAGEETRLGVFDLSSVPVSVSSGGAEVSVNGQSFERRIEKAGFWKIENAAASSPITFVIQQLVQRVLPAVDFRMVVNGQETEEISWKPGDSRMGAVSKLLEAASLQAYFDRDNRFIVEHAPGLDDLAGGITQWKWDLVDGVNGVVANLHSASHTFSDEESYNGVVIEASNNADAQAEPFYFTMWNTNPASPLYYDPLNPTASPTGPRAKHIRAEDTITTESQAQAMALTELAKVMMVAEQVECEAPANALVKMGDYARFASDALGVDGVYRVSRVSHDLAGGPIELTLSRFANA